MGPSGHVLSNYALPHDLFYSHMVSYVINHNQVCFVGFFFGGWGVLLIWFCVCAVCLLTCFLCLFFWLKPIFPLTASFFPESLLYFLHCSCLCFVFSVSAPPGLESSSESSAIFSLASCTPIWEKHFYFSMDNFLINSFSLLYTLFCYCYLYKLIFTCHCVPLI